jgi:hypothetical protein
MRPRKPNKLNAIVQVNLRIDEQLRRQLEADAKAHRVTFSQEVRLRLTGATQSLTSSLADFERNAGDIIERNAKDNARDIEAAWRRRAELRTKLAHLQTGVEEVLMPDLRDSKELRELVRGAQQEREKGGKA